MQGGFRIKTDILHVKYNILKIDTELPASEKILTVIQQLINQSNFEVSYGQFHRVLHTRLYLSTVK